MVGGALRRRSTLSLSAAVALALCILPGIVLADGELDQSFSGDGKTVLDLGGEDSGTDVAITDSGKVLVAATGEPGGQSDIMLLRYTRRGRLDRTFSHDGIARARFPSFAFANALAVQDDGRIVVAGQTFEKATNYDFAVARFLPGGRLDRTFSGDGRKTIAFADAARYDTANDVALTPSGRILLAGTATANPDDNDIGLARLKPNGALDPDFSDDGRATLDAGSTGDQANAVAIQPAGKIVIVGETFSGGETRFLVARFRPNGTPDPGFAGGIVITDFPDDEAGEVDVARAVALDGNGRIVCPTPTSTATDCRPSIS